MLVSALIIGWSDLLSWASRKRSGLNGWGEGSPEDSPAVQTLVYSLKATGTLRTDAGGPLSSVRYLEKINVRIGDPSVRQIVAGIRGVCATGVGSRG
jgi:hypothetical protein